MNKEILKRLERLNQLELTEEQREEIITFFELKEKENESLNEIDTENVTRMVHVMPIETVVREDKAIKKFSREDLQKGAPETTDGYWQVPRLVE